MKVTALKILALSVVLLNQHSPLSANSLKNDTVRIHLGSATPIGASRDPRARVMPAASALVSTQGRQSGIGSGSEGLGDQHAPCRRAVRRAARKALLSGLAIGTGLTTLITADRLPFPLTDEFQKPQGSLVANPSELHTMPPSDPNGFDNIIIQRRPYMRHIRDLGVFVNKWLQENVAVSIPMEDVPQNEFIVFNDFQFFGSVRHESASPGKPETWNFSDGSGESLGYVQKTSTESGSIFYLHSPEGTLLGEAHLPTAETASMENSKSSIKGPGSWQVFDSALDEAKSQAPQAVSSGPPFWNRPFVAGDAKDLGRQEGKIPKGIDPRLSIGALLDALL